MSVLLALVRVRISFFGILIRDFCFGASAEFCSCAPVLYVHYSAISLDSQFCL